jgi:hypothetical protein
VGASPLAPPPHIRKEQTMSAVIEHTVQARLITGEDTDLPVPVVFRYDPQDPFAVRVAFPAEAALDGGGEVVWTFARDLLDDGLRAPAGEGDVLLWPCGPRHLVLELRATEGLALVEMGSGGLQGFLHACYASVPRGEEFAFDRLDQGLTALLRGV